MDEPTAVLTPQETEEMFKILKNFVATGNSVIFITHKLNEVMTITDRITVLRDGKLIVIGFIPDVYQCRPGGGNSMLMEIDAFSGGNLKSVQFDVTGGGILNQYDYVNNPNAMDPDTADLVPPAGLLFRGKLQKPVILRIEHAFRKAGYIKYHDGLDQSDDRSLGCGEEKYLSTSTGKVKTVCQKAVSLGISYWKEVARDD